MYGPEVKFVIPTGSESTHCHSCGGKLAGDETVCPHCQFDPRDIGFRVAIALVIGAVGAIVLAMASITVAPTAGMYLVFGGFLLLGLAGVVFLLAFLATPSRFSTVFSLE